MFTTMGWFDVGEAGFVDEDVETVHVLVLLSSTSALAMLSSGPSCTYVPLSINNDTMDFSTVLLHGISKLKETFRTLNSAPRINRLIAFITAPGSVVFSSVPSSSSSSTSFPTSSLSLFSFCARSISKTFSECEFNSLLS